MNTRSLILVVLALCAIIFCVSAQLDTQAPTPKAVPVQAQPGFETTAEYKTIKAEIQSYNDKLAALTKDAKALRQEIEQLRKENTQLQATIQQVKTSPKIDELNDTIAVLRTRVEKLSNDIANSSVASTLRQYSNIAQTQISTIYNQHVSPFVVQGVKQGKILYKQASVVLAPYMTQTFGATQGLLSKFYFESRKYVTMALKFMTTFLRTQTTAFKVPSQYSTIIVKEGPVVALFVGLLIVSAIVFSILSAILRLLCCCRRSSPKQQTTKGKKH